ncbi:Aminopeptidase N [Gryllus bimaculatus]|nr:Aminopeptidase N [Gryllus bimaculatus]
MITFSLLVVSCSSAGRCVGRERYLLPAPNSSSAVSRVGFILGHELAHTYFGNLVTLEWWDAIWLNEGFATYFGALALEGAQPELQVAATTAVRAFLEVFAVDALRSSHALTAAAATASDLYQIFDSITYYKANVGMDILGLNSECKGTVYSSPISMRFFL